MSKTTLQTGDTCPICGKGKVTELIVNETFKYKGKQLIISDYVIYECDRCKDAIVSDATLIRTEPILIAWRNGIDGKGKN